MTPFCVLYLRVPAETNLLRFIPENYANRMRPMVEGRSVWLLELPTYWFCSIWDDCEHNWTFEEQLNCMRIQVDFSSTLAWHQVVLLSMQHRHLLWSLGLVHFSPEILGCVRFPFDTGSNTAGCIFACASTVITVECVCVCEANSGLLSQR